MVLSEEGARERVGSGDLRNYRACGMLGAAGIGKTYELRLLAELDRQAGSDVQVVRLAVFGQTVDGLASKLEVLATGLTEKTVIYLDALDEVMVPVTTAGLVVGSWIRNTLASNKPALRISCRSAVWPPGVETAIREVYGKDECAFAWLQPLSLEDVKNVASDINVNADAFAEAVRSAGALALSEQPLTLEMLLDVYTVGGALPKSRSELFARGIESLASERIERLEIGTAVDFPPVEIVDAAERLACLALLSGRDVIDLNDSPSSLSLGLRELVGLPGGNRPFDYDILLAVGRSGLCEGDGPRRFRFAHRQFAEYVAGRRLARLLPHQAKAVLASGLGWQAGVAGPLRETAAFAAMESEEIAEWVADHDPEVVGLSDVASDALRRRATLRLFSKFRRRELTDAQIGRRHGVQLQGFQYAGAEQDLRPVLRMRDSDYDDVLECAIGMIESWNLASMGGDLADLMLDATAPLSARKSAGYALAKIGTANVRRRLLPLTADRADDPDFDLKGLALRCNWPDGMTVDQLLRAMTPERVSNYGGAYGGFLFELDRTGFDARGHRLAGLLWARQLVGQCGDYEPTMRIARRIAVASLGEIEEPGIADALANMMLTSAETHSGSLLRSRAESGSESGEAEERSSILADRVLVRRRLIDALAAQAAQNADVWHVAHETPGLLALEDFPWLLEKATTSSIPMEQRRNYADFAWMLPWDTSANCVDEWLKLREIEPVASRLGYPLYVDIESEEAARARQWYSESPRGKTSPKRPKVRLSPADRVEKVLSLSETKDSHFFLNLCQELTLEEDSTHCGFERFLTKTPGWAAIDLDTQQRIVESAKRLLTDETDAPERIRSEPLNSIFLGYMSAFWLVMEREPAWLCTQLSHWWSRWTWYVLRELHPGLSDEPDEPKVHLLRMLHEHASERVREELVGLAMSSNAETRSLLASLLRLFRNIDDKDFDTRLSDGLAAGQIPKDRVGEVAEFVLSRNSDIALSTCVALLDPAAVAKNATNAVQAAVALLRVRITESWNRVVEFLRSRPDIAPRVLAEFEHGRRWRISEDEDESVVSELTVSQIGQLVQLLMEAFPPNSDPVYEGAHPFGPEDSARELRDRLISWLGDQRDLTAVESLRTLDQRFGKEYPWLRRPRARAERAYRLSIWTPIPPRTAAELLAARDKQVIRSGGDALDGMIAAVEQYATRLRHSSPDDLEDLWNRPKKGTPTPKEEERVSEKLCAAIRNYFRDYALTADREVQIFRRKLARELGGAPGSEVDLLCRVPAVGVANRDAIAVPIEVKLSHNPEARSALREQLLNRYMSQLGTSLGVFVVIWMGTPRARSGYRPLWKSVVAAQEDLNRQAADVLSSAGGLDIRVLVVDASLPVLPKRAKKKTAKIKGKSHPAKSLKKSDPAPVGKKPKNKRPVPASKPPETVKAKKKPAVKKVAHKRGNQEQRTTARKKNPRVD